MIDAGIHFPDQSNINRVRDALWEGQGNGASVMIGSGFSKCSSKVGPTADGIPMLSDLAAEMHKRLYPRSVIQSVQVETREATSVDRILPLAQEYETAFGRTNLHKLLQEMVRNEDLQPGEMHTRLLQLPWRDVFTTNWDTLLERSSLQVLDRGYSVVNDMGEIPLAIRPRIVKLHGSFPSQFPLIFTEEDYRTYPRKFAPFVNTVQQALMESTLCLIGFSGNDPNFLNWSGWVRDNLGSAAPKIYLAGWLDLSDHRRRMLENRGVIPIDLARHPRAQGWPEHQRYLYSIDWVLHTLALGRPYDPTYWPLPMSQPRSAIPTYLQPVTEVSSNQPKSEPEGEREIDNGELQEKVKEVVEIWAHNREVFPGWLIFPTGEERESLRRRTNSWEGHILAAIPSLSAAEKLNAVHELVWRQEILLEPISDQLESTAADSLALFNCQERTINGVYEPGFDWITIRGQWRSLGLTLLTSARHRLDAELFAIRAEAMDPFVNDHPDVYNRLCQERCLQATFEMDFSELERLLEEWKVGEGDHMWIIRKAAILWETDRNSEAIALVQCALQAIRSMSEVEGSVARASREGWTLWSAFTMDNRREFRMRWNELAALKCDAMLERDLIARRIQHTESTQEAPVFDLGMRRVQGVRFVADQPELAASRLLRLTEVAGLPPVTRHGGFSGIAVAADILKPAAEVLVTYHPELAIRLVLRVCGYDKDKTLMRVLSRTRVALLSSSAAESIANSCMEVIKYALPRAISAGKPGPGIFWIERLRVAMEVLSRMVLRLATDKVEAILDNAVEFYSNSQMSQDPLLGKPLGNLLQRAWEALPRERRTARSIDLLAMPIMGLSNFSGSIDSLTPDPGQFLASDDLPSERKPEDERWHDVIKFLIGGLESEEEPRKRASVRISLVSEKELLTTTESSLVAQALWSDKHTSPNDLPGGTPLYDWAFLLLPEPTPGIAEKNFRLKWLSGDINRFQDSIHRDGNTVSFSIGTKPGNPDNVDDILWNVGSAISGLRKAGQMLRLTSDEQKYVEGAISEWVAADIPMDSILLFQGAARQPTVRAIRGLASILADEDMSMPFDERLFTKFRLLINSDTPCFELVPPLAKRMPNRYDELITWLRMGLVSNDWEMAASAISGLYSWMAALVVDGESLPMPPDDVLREIGIIIASRRSVSLPQAMQLAIWVFAEGKQFHRDALSALTIQGLSYLAEELKYDRVHEREDYTDVPLLRWRCVQLAQSMAKCGFRETPAIRLWLEAGLGDPLPEVRYAAAPMANEDEKEGERFEQAPNHLPKDDFQATSPLE